MKIGIEVQRLFRNKKFGIETSSLELIKSLRNLEPAYQYVLFAKADVDQRCLAPSDNLSVKLIGGKLFADFEQFYLPVAAGREHVDILHCTGNTTPFFSPVPVIQTLHDVIFMDPISTDDSLYQRIGNHYRRRIVPLVTPRSKAVITVSQYEKQRIIQRLGIDRNKIHVIYNGINEQHFNNSFKGDRKLAVRIRYNLPETFIFFLGNDATRKNPERVIEAYIQYSSQVNNPIPLVTPGLSDKFITDRLHKFNALNKRHLFIIPGYIHDEDLPVMYGMCKVFLFPSLSEGFGMPLIEAMACGAPAITSSASCLPEIAGSAAVLVDPYNVGELASAIRSLTTNDNLRNKMITAGLANARRFSWKRTAEKVLNLYEAVAAEERIVPKQAGFLEKYVFSTRH